MVLARELHQMPETIECMSEYWYERMVLLLEAETAYEQKKQRDRAKSRK